MANNNTVHISPGIYANSMVDMKKTTYSSGITKLGVVGETLKGPAFQPYWIHSKGEFETVFGGTSTEKFKYSQYPRYELPYIANDYLEQGTDLCVVRTLGLSGYNAGPAWLVTGEKVASGESISDKIVIAVLRSRGHYEYKPEFSDLTDDNGCPCQKAYDAIVYDVGELNTTPALCYDPISYNVSAVTLSNYYSIDYTGNDCEPYTLSGTSGGFEASYGNMGRFTINCIVGPTSGGTPEENSGATIVKIPVSLNKTDKDYIVDVLGKSNNDGDTPLYVETFYDVAWKNLVQNENYNYNIVSSALTKYNVANYADYCGLKEIDGILTKTDSQLTKSDFGKRYLYSYYGDIISPRSGVTCYEFDYNIKLPNIDENGDYITGNPEHANIYTVDAITKVNGKKTYVYRKYINTESVTNLEERISLEDKLLNIESAEILGKHATIVYNNENGLYYKNEYRDDNYTIEAITSDLNDYKSQYRYSSTPWIVSNLRGNATKIELTKLFRFHTISDGDASRKEVKVSIENIKPDSGEFDVVVRDYNDNDYAVNALERFTRCTMKHGDDYIGFRIGTIDGSYERNSKYIMVEVAENSLANISVPCGFLGYPMPNYGGNFLIDDGNNVLTPPITYNTSYNDNLPKRKQYFGISDLIGYDEDYFTYKGNLATIEDAYFVTNGFHLDCRVNENSYTSGNTPQISVDGVDGYVFNTVDVNSRTQYLNGNPIIATESEMQGSIFQDVSLRKFTVMFFGGFDGWDVFRNTRTNTDSYSIDKYYGYIENITGVGYSIDKTNGKTLFKPTDTILTSDYYSTLGAISLMKNNEEVDINLLATPGIDTINNTRLVKEIFDVLDERSDTFYIVTTPDMEYGGYDDIDGIVDDFENNELYSDNTATYYPWVKIEDNGEYVWLPPTKDMIRNIVESDKVNTTMNLAPAGTSRGVVDAIRARKNITNEESDTLYGARINPIRTFSQGGLVVMGQKTLRKVDDLMSRIDVRRMILRLRKLVSVECLGLIFEKYDDEVVDNFRIIISGIMQTFVSNRAIEEWTMNVDDSQAQRDKLELSATIYLKPIRALEYISLSFVVTNNEVYFQD